MKTQSRFGITIPSGADLFIPEQYYTNRRVNDVVTNTLTTILTSPAIAYAGTFYVSGSVTAFSDGAVDTTNVVNLVIFNGPTVVAKSAGHAAPEGNTINVFTNLQIQAGDVLTLQVKHGGLDNVTLADDQDMESKLSIFKIY